MDAQLLWAAISLFVFLAFWDFCETFREKQASSKDRVLQILGLSFFPSMYPAVLRLGYRLSRVQGLEGTDALSATVLTGGDPVPLKEDLARRMPNSALSVHDFKELGNLVDQSAELFRDRKNLVLSYDESVRVGSFTSRLLLAVPALAVLGWAVNVVPDGGSRVLAEAILRLSQTFLGGSLVAFLYAGLGAFVFLLRRDTFLKGCAKQGVVVSKQMFDVSLILKALGLGKTEKK